MQPARFAPAALALALALSACTTPAPRSAEAGPNEAFWNALSSHCGKAYAGGLVSEDARDEDWRNRKMIAHWAECSDDRVAIALHVEDAQAPGGWNRSRTWLVTRQHTILSTPRIYTSFSLKHDHRHADGEPDAVTNYGGGTIYEGGGGWRKAQDFGVDPESIELFRREGLEASTTNVWRIEVDPVDAEDARFTYQLTRRNDETRLFRVTFDASAPIDPPPPAWGWE